MINILHLIHDDKFFDYIISNFESFTNIENRFVLLSNSLTNNFLYIKNTEKIDVIISGSEEYQNLIFSNKIDVIILHSFGSEISKSFLINVKFKPIVFWISWGYDYVNLIKYEYLKPFTKLFDNKISNTNIGVKKNDSVFRNTFTKNLNRVRIQLKSISQIIDNQRSTRKLYSKIDFCSCIVPTEFKLLKMIPGFKAKFLFYTMGFSNNPFKNINDFTNLGNSIWVGNSYTLANNHIDVFYKLKDLNVDMQIIVPASYGIDYKTYPDILNVGKDLFGERFYPIVDFVAFEKYNELIKKSSVAIFYHIRQQAVGNILLMMWQGSKVFLSEQSPVFEYLKSLGAIIFSVENELSSDNLKTRLDKNEILINRKIIFQLYSKEAIELSNMKTINFLVNEVNKRKSSNKTLINE